MGVTRYNLTDVVDSVDDLVIDDVSEKTLTCVACGREFPHPSMRGRPPKFCSEKCRQGAREQHLREVRETRELESESAALTAFWNNVTEVIRGGEARRVWLESRIGKYVSWADSVGVSRNVRNDSTDERHTD